MLKRQAIKVASDYAKEQHYDTAQYDIRATKNDAVWEIYFERKKESKPRPGDFFTIYVDEQSGSVQRIIHGK